MILRGAFLIDSAGRISKDVEIKVEGTRIAAVRKKGSNPSDSDIIDLGGTALMPGFVNAHAHLELTLAESQVTPQPRFTDWIREVVRTTGEWTEDDFESSVRTGIKLSAEAGTTTIGDIGRGTRGVDAYLESGLRFRAFHEVIGFDPNAADNIFESLKSRISEQRSGDNLFIGISPHTPYTVSERLLKKCAQLARGNNWPLCIHLAETKAELQFLRDGTGEILELRKDFGLPARWSPPRASPVRYLNNLGFFERPVTLIHCNYVTEEDFDIIGLSGSSVVFCPRSHKYFGHGGHPFLRMLGHGINVALGTDSLISSPSLSMFDEMKFVYDEYPEIEPALLLRMVTENGLKALGLPAESPMPGPGSRADIVGVAMPEEKVDRFDTPLDAVFSAYSEVIFSMAGGRVLLNTSGTSGAG